MIAALAATLVAALPAAAQQRGVVTGRVLDASNHQPLTGVQVVVVGSTTGTITNPQGEYRLGGVRAGTLTVRAIMLGYDTQDRTVTVPAGGTATADFRLPLSAVALNQIVVTVTGEQRKAALPNAVTTVDAAAVTQTQPISDVAQLLNGRASGVNVLESSGTVGTGAKIRIRGSNSVSLSNEPIIYVDGARLDNDPNSLSVGTGGQAVSRLEDINPEDIESIEVVKGPSAATLYGTDAANGVIRITTKRGHSGRPSWNFFAEAGALNNSIDFPLNYRGKSTAGVHGHTCFAYQQGEGTCTQLDILSYQPLNDPVVSPFKAGNTRSVGGSVAGGNDNVTYYLSGDYQNQIGDLELPDSLARASTAAGNPPTTWMSHPNSDRRISVRANVVAHVTESLNLTASTGYTTNRIFLPQNDNNAFGIVPSGVLGTYSPLLGQHGYGFLNPLEVFSIMVQQDINRSTSSLQANWQPQQLSWLSARGNIGLDLNDRHDGDFTPVGAVQEFGPVLASGERTSNRLLNHVWTADASATATANPRTWLSSRLTVGTQYIHNLLQGTFANGDGLVPGTMSLSASSEQFASEATVESKTLGFFGEEQLGFHDRLYVTAGLRDDDNSAFGKSFKAELYPKVGASYVVIDDSNHPFYFVNSLRLRTAWGESGVAPGPRDALLFFSPSAASLHNATGTAVVTVPGVTFGAFGNPNLKPERSAELELGFDAGLFGGRAGLEASFYNKKTSDALISRPLPASLGGALARFDNIGSVQNRGVEVGLNGTPVNLRAVKWDLNANGSYNQNKLLKLGTDVNGNPLPPIVSGIQQFRPGYPLGGYWDFPITFKDANHDGIIESNEITKGDTAVFLGSDLPSTDVSITNALTFFNRLRVSALLDHRGGFKNYNQTEEFRCEFAICRGLNDPHAPLALQARAVDTWTLGGARSAAPYVEDASFWKLREVSFTLFIPRSVSDRIGSHNLELVVTGRNLHTWTNYTGFDPEINENGQANFQQDEFLTQPPLRTWMIRLNASF